MEPETAPNTAHDDGAIVGGDDLVDADDSRVAALQPAYNDETYEAEQYRQSLEARGFDTSRFKRPVLIRRRLNALTPEERASFVGNQKGNNIDLSDNTLAAIYGPAIARLLNGTLSPSIADALRSVAGDWRRLRLAAREGAPWMEATPHLRAAVAAAAQSRAAGRPVGSLVLDGALVDTGFTEAAYGFLRLMHADAALSQEADTATIVERLKDAIFALETQGTGSAPTTEVREAKRAPRFSLPLGERAAAAVERLSGWATTPRLGTAKLSATTDFDALRQVAALNDLPATRLMNRWFDHVRSDRDAAARAGVTAELWLAEMVDVFRRQNVVMGELSAL